MKKLVLSAIAVLALTACRQNDSMLDAGSNFEMQSASADYNVTGLPVTTINGPVNSSNNNWSGVIVLDGVVTVPSGVTLTIQPGTFIIAKPAAAGVATGVLAVLKGGVLNANGTASQPIIFTSYNLLDGNASTTGVPGDFGGVVILGKAQVNTGTTLNVIEGLTDQSNPADYYYGDTSTTYNTESSGSLKYVRIEYAGRIIGDGNELNGLTLGGVGSGTTLQNIQVSYGADDAFEFFGGTVNASNLIAFAQDDDGFDFDLGYTGTIDCALALADYNSTHSVSGTSPDSNGIELDNNAVGSAALPLTHPTINNLTIVGVKDQTPHGVKYENGIHVRRHGQLTLNDAVVTGYPVGIKVEGTGSLISAVNTKAHGFTTAFTGAGTGTGITGATGTTAATWGMTQPFFNNTPIWNVNPRNCGDFKGTWTKYVAF